jgi:SAM-dependent methyltransferase
MYHAGMYLDVVDLRAFYGERLGLVARRLIAARLKERWPSLAGESLLGLGYATPYLRNLGEGAERVLAFMPQAQGVVNWPREGPNAAALVDEESLPLNDASIDRVLLVHCLETAHEERNQLREVWRVLAPGGRLLLVVPNRQGIWARTETTPFGTGRPFGRTQLTQLLRDANFSPLGWSEALYVPPFRRRSWVRTGATWERIGRWLWPAFAGVIIVEATKQLYQGLPARERARLKPAFTPALIPPGA